METELYGRKKDGYDWDQETDRRVQQVFQPQATRHNEEDSYTEREVAKAINHITSLRTLKNLDL